MSRVVALCHPSVLEPSSQLSSSYHGNLGPIVELTMRNRHVHTAPIWKIARAVSKMDPKGYYTCLRVEPFATADQIRTAYRRCAKRWHPDVDPSPWARARFQAINEAYRTLSTPSQRVAYDQMRWAAAVDDCMIWRASARWRRTERGWSPQAVGSRLSLSFFAGALGLVSLALLF
jgi:hypothetical protein